MTLLERLKPEFAEKLNEKDPTTSDSFYDETMEVLEKTSFFTELKIYECMAICYAIHKAAFIDIAQIHILFNDNEN